MTDNIQKLYEIAGVEKQPVYSGSQLYNPVITGHEYSPFTAEEQLKLIKFISNTDVFGNFHCYIVSARWSIDYGKWAVGVGGCDVCHEQFEQALAGLVLEMWDGIPVNQKQEIKKILQ